MLQDNFSLILSLYLIDIEMVNKYFIGSHISERKFRQIVRFFCLDIEAKKTAELTGISRQSINKITHLLGKDYKIHFVFLMYFTLCF